MFCLARLDAPDALAREGDFGRGGPSTLGHSHESISYVKNADKLLEEDVAEVEVALLSDIEHPIHVVYGLDGDAAVGFCVQIDCVICLHLVDREIEGGHVGAKRKVKATWED